MEKMEEKKKCWSKIIKCMVVSGGGDGGGFWGGSHIP